MSLTKAQKLKIEEEESYRTKLRKGKQAKTVSHGRNNIAAGLLAIFLGDLGIHKFYLGKSGQGILILILNLLFFWTIIVPAVIGIICFIEGVIYLTSDSETFYKKYS